MSAVDKKLMDQVLRLGKRTAVSTADQYGSRLSEDNAAQREVMRRVIERGMTSLPLEQRVLFGFERGQQAEELGRDQLLRLLGTWGSLTVDALSREFPHMDVDSFLGRYEAEGLIERKTLYTSEGEQEYVVLTDDGARQFALREGQWDEKAGELFSELSELNEYEKMQLYLLLRKMMGTPAHDAQAEERVATA